MDSNKLHSVLAIGETIAVELGSGVRKLYRYVPRYSGKEPELLAQGGVYHTLYETQFNTISRQKP